MKVERVRADVLLVTRGLAVSRTAAQALIMAGDVYTSDARIEKPGTLVHADAEIRVRAGRRFVSRGGEKLDGALSVFEPQGLVVRNAFCADIGASTGGFTDCLLQRGAARVASVDVGVGQLAQKLRDDSRVFVIEGKNARDLVPADLPFSVNLVVVDASFIGLGALAEPLYSLLSLGGDLVALVKPQFEAGREAARKGRGVIRDEHVRAAAIASGKQALTQVGFTIVNEIDSPLRGPKGNLERFVWARRAPPNPKK
ncbi:MAG: TlyA family RNA methyltransferase [Polyangiaceae bacterium]|nr:TlyA family RNA methyltransferase [Polyangiaceae bacterium]